MSVAKGWIAPLFVGLASLLGAALGSAADDALGRTEVSSPLERWERLTDAQRDRLRERFDRYQRMSEEEQHELAERASNLRRTKQRILARLSAEERDRLRALETERRAEIEGELLEDELKAQGRRLHAKLPDEWRARLEGASPEERLRFFTEFKEKNRARMSLIALENLGRRLGHERSEIQTWKQLPDQDRLEKVLELRKLLQERSVEANGLPVGLTPEKWSEMLTLGPEEFFDEVMRIRDTGGWREAPPVAGEEPELARRRTAMDILGELRASPAERLELADLPAAERKAEISRRRRARIEALLRSREAFPAALLDELAALPEGEFYTRVRSLVRESGALEERPDVPVAPASDR